MVFVVVAWVPFRARTIGETFALWRGMAGLNGFALPALGPVQRLAPWLGSEAIWFTPGDLLVLLFAATLAIAAPE